ncbi:MAG: Hpt domain-containing protein [Spirochaetales bacterium]|nr:Hpt domain-containing protein [Spirochaetales bacterium]MCF7937587.1 Hpt domain-containing protein [Spirochaetales bacterium]
MPDKRDLVTGFCDDANRLIGELNNAFLELEQGKVEAERFNEAFRNAHSLKSEAAFLDFTSLAHLAHELEDILQLMRDGKVKPEKEVIDLCFQAVDTMKEMIGMVESGNRDDAVDATDVLESLRRWKQPDGPIAVAEVDPKAALFRITDFERGLIAEARERGEQLYRAICTISPASPMKYPRAYLVVNNLEMISNVVKVYPSLDSEDDAAFSRFVIFYTTNKPEQDLRGAFAVDEIENVDIEEVDYRMYLSGQVSEDLQSRLRVERPNSGLSVRMDSRILDESLGYLDELKIRVHDIDGLLTGKVDSERAAEQMLSKLSEIARISSGVERALRQARLAPIGQVFERFSRLVRDLGASLEKQAELKINGSELNIDRSIIEVINDPLLHLIRNSVDHGIELPEERSSSGKSPTGKIFVDASIEAGNLTIIIEDDGSGIDEQQVRQRAEELGMDAEQELLDILCTPGFSTSATVSDISGRGVGMDLIYDKVVNVLGGRISIDNRPGRGVRFTLTMPLNGGILKLLVMRSREYTFALPRRHILEVAPLEEGDIQTVTEGTSEGRKMYRGSYPVILLRTSRMKQRPEGESTGWNGNYAVLISYLGAEACLVVDELVLEEDLPEGEIQLGSELLPYLYECYRSGKLKEYLYLSPAVVSV